MGFEPPSVTTRLDRSPTEAQKGGSLTTGGRLDITTELYLRLDGRPGMRPVIERFYDKMSRHPVLGQFFEGVDLRRQAQRLEDFLCTGVPDEPVFDGAYPMRAHAHMLITQDMLRERVRLLEAAILESGHGEEVARLWLRADAQWHSAVRKRDLSDCRPSLSGKPLRVVRPEGTE